KIAQFLRRATIRSTKPPVDAARHTLVFLPEGEISTNKSFGRQKAFEKSPWKRDAYERDRLGVGFRCRTNGEARGAAAGRAAGTLKALMLSHRGDDSFAARPLPEVHTRARFYPVGRCSWKVLFRFLGMLPPFQSQPRVLSQRSGSIGCAST